MTQPAAPTAAFPEGDYKTCTIAQGQDWLRPRLTVGAICPLCHQFAKIYKRKLSSSMAYALILIYRAFRNGPDVWLHVPEYLSRNSLFGVVVRGGDWAKLVHWGLIVSKGDEVRDDKSPRTGLYKITDLGRAFVEGRVSVPRYAYIYNEQCLRMSDETLVTIQQALGDRFNYAELMSPAT